MVAVSRTGSAGRAEKLDREDHFSSTTQKIILVALTALCALGAFMYLPAPLGMLMGSFLSVISLILLSVPVDGDEAGDLSLPTARDRALEQLTDARMYSRLEDSKGDAGEEKHPDHGPSFSGSVRRVYNIGSMELGEDRSSTGSFDEVSSLDAARRNSLAGGSGATTFPTSQTPDIATGVRGEWFEISLDGEMPTPPASLRSLEPPPQRRTRKRADSGVPTPLPRTQRSLDAARKRSAEEGDHGRRRGSFTERIARATSRAASIASTTAGDFARATSGFLAVPGSPSSVVSEGARGRTGSGGSFFSAFFGDDFDARRPRGSDVSSLTDKVLSSTVKHKKTKE